MSPLMDQERVALIVARSVFESILEHDPGPCVEQNGCRTELTVDATFDESVPPVAVEITRLKSDFEALDPHALERLRRALHRHAQQLGHADWIIAFRSGVQLKGALRSELKRGMRLITEAGFEGLGPVFSSRWIAQWPLERFGSDFYGFLDRLRALGVVSLERVSDGRGIDMLPLVEFSDHQSLQRPLKRALDDNRKKLRSCSALGYQTVLLVEVLRTDAVQDLVFSNRAPDLGSGIDRLWLFSLSSTSDESKATVWLSDRSDRTWQRGVINLTDDPETVCDECN